MFLVPGIDHGSYGHVRPALSGGWVEFYEPFARILCPPFSYGNRVFGFPCGMFAFGFFSLPGLLAWSFC